MNTNSNYSFIVILLDFQGTMPEPVVWVATGPVGTMPRAIKDFALQKLLVVIPSSKNLTCSCLKGLTTLPTRKGALRMFTSPPAPTDSRLHLTSPSRRLSGWESWTGLQRPVLSQQLNTVTPSAPMKTHRQSARLPVFVSCPWWLKPPGLGPQSL